MQTDSETRAAQPSHLLLRRYEDLSTKTNHAHPDLTTSPPLLQFDFDPQPCASPSNPSNNMYANMAPGEGSPNSASLLQIRPSASSLTSCNFSSMACCPDPNKLEFYASHSGMLNSNFDMKTLPVSGQLSTCNVDFGLFTESSPNQFSQFTSASPVVNSSVNDLSNDFCDYWDDFFGPSSFCLDSGVLEREDVDGNRTSESSSPASNVATFNSTTPSSLNLYEEIERTMTAEVERNVDSCCSSPSSASPDGIMSQMPMLPDDNIPSHVLDFYLTDQVPLQAPNQCYSDHNPDVLSASQTDYPDYPGAPGCNGLLDSVVDSKLSFGEVLSRQSSTCSSVHFVNLQVYQPDLCDSSSTAPLMVENFCSDMTACSTFSLNSCTNGHASPVGDTKQQPSLTGDSQIISMSEEVVETSLPSSAFSEECSNDVTPETVIVTNERKRVIENQANSEDASKPLPKYLQSVKNANRKLRQNKEAAQRYRSKKRQEGDNLVGGLEELQTKKVKLQARVDLKKREVELLENLLEEIQKGQN